MHGRLGGLHGWKSLEEEHVSKMGRVVLVGARDVEVVGGSVRVVVDVVEAVGSGVVVGAIDVVVGKVRLKHEFTRTPSQTPMRPFMVHILPSCFAE